MASSTSLDIPVRRKIRGASLANDPTTVDTTPVDMLPDEIVLSILEKAVASSVSPSCIRGLWLVSRRFHRLMSEPAVLRAVSPSAMITHAAVWSKVEGGAGSLGAARFILLCGLAGNTNALYIFGMIKFYCLRDFWTGAALLVSAAERGHVGALVSLAVIHAHGSGGAAGDVKPSLGAEIMWHAAMRGSAVALQELGHCYLDGYGVSKNLALGARLLLLAASPAAGAASLLSTTVAEEDPTEAKGHERHDGVPNSVDGDREGGGRGEGDRQHLGGSSEDIFPRRPWSRVGQNEQVTSVICEKICVDGGWRGGGCTNRRPVATGGREEENRSHPTTVTFAQPGEAGGHYCSVTTTRPGSWAVGPCERSSSTEQRPTASASSTADGANLPEGGNRPVVSVVCCRGGCHLTVSVLSPVQHGHAILGNQSQGSTSSGRKLNLFSPLERDMFQAEKLPCQNIFRFFAEWAALRGLPAGCQACQNERCNRPETRSHEFRCCVVCEKAAYCSRSCQVAVWKSRHYIECSSNIQ